MNQKTN